MFDLTTTNEVQMMTSREIAELTGKEHAHVMRDVREMLEILGQSDNPDLDSQYQGSRRMEKCYKLPKDLTLTLVSGYNIKMRYAIIKRWEELEAGAKPEVAKIPVDPRFDMVMHGLNSFKASQDNAAMQGFVEAEVNDPSDYFSMGKLLKRRGATISSQVANRALAFKGVIQRGAEAGQPHCDWVVTEKGRKYGFNHTTSRAQAKTEPRWYRDREEDLYIFIMGVVNEMGVLSTVPTLTSALAEAVEIVPSNATSPALEQARALPIYPGMFQKLKNLINFK